MVATANGSGNPAIYEHVTLHPERLPALHTEDIPLVQSICRNDCIRSQFRVRLSFCGGPGS